MELELPDLDPDSTWSVCLRDADTGEVLAAREPQRLLRTASVGKIFLLVEVARQLAAGELDADEPLTWEESEKVADSGIWYLMRTRTLPLTDVCVLIGSFSDNLATNVLLARVGLDPVRRAARAVGCAESALLDRIRDQGRGPDDPPTLSVGRADELSELLARLHTGRVVSPEVSARVLRWLGANADLSMVAAPWGLDPLAHDEFDELDGGPRHLVNKTGTISTARVDIGVLRSPERAVAYAVGANWAEGCDRRSRVLADMAAIGTVIEQWLQQVPQLRRSPGTPAASADR